MKKIVCCFIGEADISTYLRNHNSIYVRPVRDTMNIFFGEFVGFFLFFKSDFPKFILNFLCMQCCFFLPLVVVIRSFWALFFFYRVRPCIVFINVFRFFTFPMLRFDYLQREIRLQRPTISAIFLFS